MKVGVVSFASTAGVDLKPTTDHKKVQSVVNGLRAKGETSLYAGVQKGVAALGTEGERSIVLLSDGEDTVAENDGGAANEKSQRAAAVRALQQGKVRAEVVAFKNDAGQAVLNTFARAGGGTVVSAADREAVKTAFDTAAQTLQSQVRFDITVPTGLTGVYDVALDGSADGQDFSTVQRVDVTASEPVVDESAVGALPDGVTNGQAPDGADGVDLRGLPADRPGGDAPRGLHHRPLHVRTGVPVASQGAPRRDRRVRHRRWWVRAEATRGRTTASSASSSSRWATGSCPGASRRRRPCGASSGRTCRGVPGSGSSSGSSRSWSASSSSRSCWAASRSSSALPVGVLVGLLFPVMALRYLANRRAKKFEAVLPDVMMLVATSLSSGFSLLQALDSVARDAAEPAAKEFSRALAESRIGSDISDALEHVAVRMESENMRWAVMAIRIQREVGGNLADTLRTTAATLREREMLKRHVRALSAEGRLSAYILIALPIGVLLVLDVEQLRLRQPAVDDAAGHHHVRHGHPGDAVRHLVDAARP